MQDMLFDPSKVPSDVMSADSVALVNEIVNCLRSLIIDHIHIPEEGSGFRVTNMIRAYNQAHIRRCIHRIESAHYNMYQGYGLVSLMIVRSIYETVANFLDFESKLQKALSDRDLGKIHDLVHTRTFSTRLSHLIKKADTDSVRATSILTQIDKMERIRKETRADYEHLCEYTHPNSFGSYLYFAERDNHNDTVTFLDRGPDQNSDLRWVLISGHLLIYVIEALRRIDEQLPGLSDLGHKERPLHT